MDTLPPLPVCVQGKGCFLLTTALSAAAVSQLATLCERSLAAAVDDNFAACKGHLALYWQGQGGSFSLDSRLASLNSLGQKKTMTYPPFPQSCYDDRVFSVALRRTCLAFKGHQARLEEGRRRRYHKRFMGQKKRAQTKYCKLFVVMLYVHRPLYRQIKKKESNCSKARPEKRFLVSKKRPIDRLSKLLNWFGSMWHFCESVSSSRKGEARVALFNVTMSRCNWTPFKAWVDWCRALHTT